MCVTDAHDDTDRLVVSLMVEDEQLDTLLVTVWLEESETEPLVETDGDDDTEAVKDTVTEAVDV